MALKFTPEGLPVVSRCVVNVFMRDYLIRYEEDTAVEYTIKFSEIIKKDNPELYRYLSDMAKYFNETSEVEKMTNHFEGFCFAYELLRRQAETNQLEEFSD